MFLNPKIDGVIQVNTGMRFFRCLPEIRQTLTFLDMLIQFLYAICLSCSNFGCTYYLHVHNWADSRPGLILGLRPANERRHYKVTPSLIGWAQT